MAIAHSKVTAQGQISVPAKVRRKLGIGPGSVLDLALEDSEVVSNALANFRQRPALGFSDCLVVSVARKAGHLPLGTFDRNLAKFEGATRL